MAEGAQGAFLALAALEGPEQPARLVEEGDVCLCPGDLFMRGAPRPVEQLLLFGAEQPPARELDERPRAEEVVQKRLGGKPGPHSLEQLADLAALAELCPKLRGGQGASSA